MDKHSKQNGAQNDGTALGNRNPVAVVARARNSAGHMRDRRNRRSKDARKSWKNEKW